MEVREVNLNFICLEKDNLYTNSQLSSNTNH